MFLVPVLILSVVFNALALQRKPEVVFKCQEHNGEWVELNLSLETALKSVVLRKHIGDTNHLASIPEFEYKGKGCTAETIKTAFKLMENPEELQLPDVKLIELSAPDQLDIPYLYRICLAFFGRFAEKDELETLDCLPSFKADLEQKMSLYCQAEPLPAVTQSTLHAALKSKLVFDYIIQKGEIPKSFHFDGCNGETLHMAVKAMELNSNDYWNLEDYFGPLIVFAFRNDLTQFFKFSVEFFVKSENKKLLLTSVTDPVLRLILQDDSIESMDQRFTIQCGPQGKATYSTQVPLLVALKSHYIDQLISSTGVMHTWCGFTRRVCTKETLDIAIRAMEGKSFQHLITNENFGFLLKLERQMKIPILYEIGLDYFVSSNDMNLLLKNVDDLGKRLKEEAMRAEPMNQMIILQCGPRHGGIFSTTVPLSVALKSRDVYKYVAQDKDFPHIYRLTRKACNEETLTIAIRAMKGLSVTNWITDMNVEPLKMLASPTKYDENGDLSEGPYLNLPNLRKACLEYEYEKNPSDIELEDFKAGLSHESPKGRMMLKYRGKNGRLMGMDLNVETALKSGVLKKHIEASNNQDIPEFQYKGTCSAKTIQRAFRIIENHEEFSHPFEDVENLIKLSEPDQLDIPYLYRICLAVFGREMEYSLLNNIVHERRALRFEHDLKQDFTLYCGTPKAITDSVQMPFFAALRIKKVFDEVIQKDVIPTSFGFANKACNKETLRIIVQSTAIDSKLYAPALINRSNFGRLLTLIYEYYNMEFINLDVDCFKYFAKSVTKDDLLRSIPDPRIQTKFKQEMIKPKEFPWMISDQFTLQCGHDRIQMPLKIAIHSKSVYHYFVLQKGYPTKLELAKEVCDAETLYIAVKALKGEAFESLITDQNVANLELLASQAQMDDAGEFLEGPFLDLPALYDACVKYRVRSQNNARLRTLRAIAGISDSE